MPLYLVLPEILSLFQSLSKYNISRQDFDNQSRDCLTLQKYIWNTSIPWPLNFGGKKICGSLYLLSSSGTWPVTLICSSAKYLAACPFAALDTTLLRELRVLKRQTTMCFNRVENRYFKKYGKWSSVLSLLTPLPLEPERESSRLTRGQQLLEAPTVYSKWPRDPRRVWARVVSLPFRVLQQVTWFKSLTKVDLANNNPLILSVRNEFKIMGKNFRIWKPEF